MTLSYPLATATVMATVMVTVMVTGMIQTRGAEQEYCTNSKKASDGNRRRLLFFNSRINVLFKQGQQLTVELVYAILIEVALVIKRTI